MDQSSVCEAVRSVNDARTAKDASAPLLARVRTLRHEADRVMSVELVPAPGSVFPAFTPGAHIDLHLPNGLIRSYSLVNSPGETDRYVLGILSDERSRGGSKYVHEQLRCGAVLPIGRPRNHFALDEAAASTVLIAGGIGVTPMLCMYRELRRQDRAVSFVYCARSRAQAAFLAELHALGGDVRLYFDDEHDGRPFDLAALLAQQSPGVHAYCCGPNGMLKAFETACAVAGIENVHIERFAASSPVSAIAATGYTVELARSGRTLDVPAGKALLDVLLEAGVEVDHSCREGLCGACETRVLGGCIEHRDSVLTQSEKAAGKVMMICVSTAKSGTLVLDLA